MSDQRIPISQLSETQTAPDASYIAIDDGSLTKKITVENFNSTSTASAQQYANQAAESAQTVEDNIATSAAQIREATLAAREATQASTAATASAASAYDSASLAQNYSVNAATSAGQAMNAADTVAQGVTESKEYAEDSEAWAVGKRNGSDVPSSDAAYHNNAKYYSDNASSDADRAEAAAESINVPDTTLTISGVAADSKTTGDKITELKNDLDDVRSNLYTEEIAANLLYLDTVTPNVYINNKNGNEVTYNGWGATDYIPVVGGENYIFIGCYTVGGMYEYIRTDYYAFYDEQKAYISGGFNSRGAITTPANAAYIRESTNLPAFTSAMYATMFGLNSDLGSFVGQKTKADYIEPATTLSPSDFLVNTVNDIVGHTVRVETDGSGDFTTLKDAIEYSAVHEDTTILVGNGTYDLITEFGASYFSTMTTADQRQGLQIGNGVHIIFSSGAKVTAHYTGDNDAVKTCFSPFNFIQGSKGFTLENLTLEASNVRYCIHDEGGNNRTPKLYKNVYKNCRMTIDNSQNAAWSHHQCIGGGLGLHGEILVEDCIFTDLYNINYRVPAVSYHNAAGAGAKSRIVVKGCWFSKDATVRVSWYGTSEEMTEAIVHDNSVTVAPYTSAEASSATVENVQMFAWNNEIRTA